MITWDTLAEHEGNTFRGVDWSDCRGIRDIDFRSIPDKSKVYVAEAYISQKIHVDEPSLLQNALECENVKKLGTVERTIYCAANYYLEQMNDGLMGVITGYMSPLIFEIRSALKEIGATENLAALEAMLQKVNVEHKPEAELLTDIENEALHHLYDDETEDEYYDYFDKLETKVYASKEDVWDLTCAYITKMLEA